MESRAPKILPVSYHGPRRCSTRAFPFPLLVAGGGPWERDFSRTPARTQPVRAVFFPLGECMCAPGTPLGARGGDFTESLSPHCAGRKINTSFFPKPGSELVSKDGASGAPARARHINRTHTHTLSPSRLTGEGAQRSAGPLVVRLGCRVRLRRTCRKSGRLGDDGVIDAPTGPDDSTIDR